MKKIYLACACAAIALAACDQKPDAPELTAAPDVPSLEDPAEQTVAAPPEPVKAEPAPAEPEVAPPPPKPTAGSTVWAVTRISVTTDDGIFAVSPGSKLRVVRETETGYVVTDERQEFNVSEGQVSLSSSTASDALRAEAAARAATLEWRKSQTASGAKNAQVATANQALGEMQNRYDMLVREEAQLKAGLQRAHSELMESFNAKSQRRVFTRTISDGQAAAWKARLPVVQAEKEKLFWELKRARQ